MSTLTKEEHGRVANLLRQYEAFGVGLRDAWVTHARGTRQAWIRRGRLLIGSHQERDMYLLWVLDSVATPVIPTPNDAHLGLSTHPQVQGHHIWINGEPGPWFDQLRALLPHLEAELAQAIADAASDLAFSERIEGQARAVKLRRLAQTMRLDVAS